MKITDKVAAQLYTVRDYTQDAASLATTLERVAKIGYRAVQFSAVGAMQGDSPSVTAKEARRLLDDNGLKCIATHRDFDALVNDADREIDYHHALGCNYAAIGMLPENYRRTGVDGYRQWLSDARVTMAKLKAAGIAFGYHNHALEFIRSTDRTECGYEVFVSEGGADLQMEMDVYWVHHAGADPIRWIERLAGRLSVVHIKDKEVVEWDGIMAPIGEGNMDWLRIIASLDKAGTDWYCVEQDVCRRDPFDCLRSSFEYLSGLEI
jgi:sugar phosphate isomerase/epimerase